MDTADRQAIHEAVLRYCRGVDRLDMDLVRSAYHPGGIDHHTGFSGPIEEFVTWLPERVKHFDGTMHLIGNHFAEGDGEKAVTETYGTAVHWGQPADDPTRNFTSGFRYVDHFEKRDDVWAVAERWAIREWTRSDAGRLMAKEGDGPSPHRGSDDRIFTLKRQLGV